jgi:DNA-binding transcriptional LysR family regulator
MELDPISLRLFVHIAETGTLVESSRRLNIVPSAASKRIAILESQLDAQLLRRTNHGVELTAAGQALETMARRVLGELDGIRPQIRDYSQGIRGRVRVLASASAICQFLPGELASFLAAHPQIEVHFEERDSEGILKGVAENIADIGISFAAQHGHALQDVAYHRYQLGVLVPKGHPLAGSRSVSFAQTLDHPHIGLWSSSAANLYMNRRAAELNRAVSYRMYVDSYLSMALLVQSGLGVGIVPSGLVKPFARNFGVVLVRLDEDWAARELRIFFPSYERLQAASRLLVEHLQSH